MLISEIIFFLSIIKAIGSMKINPTRNLEQLKVRGPILSIPVSWAIKAVPQIKVVMSAQNNEADFVILK